MEWPSYRTSRLPGQRYWEKYENSFNFSRHIFTRLCLDYISSSNTLLVSLCSLCLKNVQNCTSLSMSSTHLLLSELAVWHLSLAVHFFPQENPIFKYINNLGFFPFVRLSLDRQKYKNSSNTKNNTFPLHFVIFVIAYMWR